MEDTLYVTPNQKNSKSFSKQSVIISLAILVTLVIGGLIIMAQSPKKTVKTSAVVVTKAPTPTEKPKIDKSTVRIQVVNGTGIAGQAGIVIKALTDAGYNPDNIKSINADTYDNTVFTITGRTNFDEVITDIVTVLKPNFNDIAINSSKLDEASLFDIVVLTGNATSTIPTTSPTGSLSSTPVPTTVPTTESVPSPTLSPTTAP